MEGENLRDNENLRSAIEKIALLFKQKRNEKREIAQSRAVGDKNARLADRAKYWSDTENMRPSNTLVSTIFERSILTRALQKPSKNTAYGRHKDEKLMFGGVLETLVEKKKREKRQTKCGEEVKSIGSDSSDSESYWLANMSPKTVKILRKNPIENQTSAPLTLEKNKISMPEILARNIITIPLLTSDPVPLMISDEQIKYPSVTRILSDTMSPESKAALEKWKEKMIAKLGLEGFLQHNKEQLAFGAEFHGLVRQFLEGNDPSIDAGHEKVWASVAPVLSKISDVKLLETNVLHPKLKYKGIVDCLATYKETPCVIEWKVSEKPKSTLAATFDAPLQLTAYLGALSYVIESRVTNGLVVVVYKNGSPADVFRMDDKSCRKYWSLWLHRLQKYWLELK